ncbi:BglG family transcription antiterminator [Tetragenococcus koreensis]|uniref:BglG family transcription antiterminator n=1 Tax=Tetragenococcus koreensis TaxID=290335 RepID=UPI001F2FAE5C|nr:PRD domain-containing protein [Tetragenococcus koreensis]MCF1627714.1 PRD domain-containing protein [Tetragenococcus koreensis]
MQLSKRENYLIEILMKNNMMLTAHQLAEISSVSTKTIYRTVKKINEESAEGDIIISEIGKGFRLDYDKYLHLNTENKMTTKEKESLVRRNNIILKLLFKAPNSIRINDLFSHYFVSEAVIFKDIKKIESFVKNYYLKLHRKNGRLAVEGQEKDIRKAVNYLIEGKELTDETFRTDFQHISAYDIDFLTSLLKDIENQLGTAISYPYNVNIFSHLYILMKRNREGSIEMQEDISLDDEEDQLIKNHQTIFEVSKKVINRVSNYLSSELDEIEIFYLFNYLISSRLEDFNDHSCKSNEKSKEVTSYLMEEMSKKLGTIIMEKEYKEDLLSHVTPLLYRLRNEIFIKNDLVQDIQLEYPEMFKAVESVTRKVEKKFDLPQISVDEIGFLVLYFVKYKEMRNIQKRVLIMCSSGVGTSELLKVKVQKAFPEIEIVDVVSSKRFMKNIENYQDIDLILTTIHLNKDVGIPSLLVNAIFTKQDEERTKNML